MSLPNDRLQVIDHGDASLPATGRSSAADQQSARDGPMSPVEDEKFLCDHIESFGAGLAQVRAVGLGAGAYFGEGSMIILLSSLTATIAEQWALSPFQKGLILTLVFFGILVGNFTSGPFGDGIGRRKVICASLFGLFGFSALAGTSVNYLALLATAYFLGFSFGVGQPSWNALGAEVTPARWRVVTASTAQALFTFGECYTCLLLVADDPAMKVLHWRWLLWVGCIPIGVQAVLATLFLNESPYWLAIKGRVADAKDVLASMRHNNGFPDDGPLDFKAPKVAMVKSARQRADEMSWAGFMRQMKTVFGRQLWSQTLIVMYSCFAYNFMYYGGIYGFAQLLPSTGDGGAAALELLVGALWELPGLLVACLPLPRKVMLRFYMLVTGAGFVFFNIGRASGAHGLMYAGFYGVKMSGIVGCTVLYQYATEIYPTDVRTMGSAVSLSGGRIGGMIAPLAYEAVTGLTGSPYVFFWVLAACLGLNFFLVSLLKYETAGKPLKEFLTPRCDDDALLTPAPLNSARA